MDVNVPFIETCGKPKVAATEMSATLCRKDQRKTPEIYRRRGRTAINRLRLDPNHQRRFGKNGNINFGGNNNKKWQKSGQISILIILIVLITSLVVFALTYSLINKEPIVSRRHRHVAHHEEETSIGYSFKCDPMFDQIFPPSSTTYDNDTQIFSIKVQNGCPINSCKERADNFDGIYAISVIEMFHGTPKTTGLTMFYSNSSFVESSHAYISISSKIHRRESSIGFLLTEKSSKSKALHGRKQNAGFSPLDLLFDDETLQKLNGNIFIKSMLDNLSVKKSNYVAATNAALNDYNCTYNEMSFAVSKCGKNITENCSENFGNDQLNLSLVNEKLDLLAFSNDKNNNNPMSTVATESNMGSLDLGEPCSPSAIISNIFEKYGHDPAAFQNENKITGAPTYLHKYRTMSDENLRSPYIEAEVHSDSIDTGKSFHEYALDDVQRYGAPGDIPVQFISQKLGGDGYPRNVYPAKSKADLSESENAQNKVYLFVKDRKDRFAKLYFGLIFEQPEEEEDEFDPINDGKYFFRPWEIYFKIELYENGEIVGTPFEGIIDNKLP